tara:strand:+ start:1240 stop:1656 length:417 start_codon:yes stop_codon:yes gene_type:complete
MSDFIRNFKWSTRVYYEDTDASGLVFYANYLKFMERARTEWLRSQGLSQLSLMKSPGIIFVVSNVTIEYFSPALFDDLLVINTRIRQLKGASLKFDQQINSDARGNLLCEGVIKVVCVDSISLKPKKIPKNVRDKILK